MSSKKGHKTLEFGEPLPVDGATAWEFGPFRVDAREGRLTRHANPVALTPKAFEALVCLLKQCNQLVTRRQLIDALWPDCYVQDSNLTGTIWMVRRALGGPDVWIETVPKRGYKLVGEVKTVCSRRTDAARMVRSREDRTTIEAYRLTLKGRFYCHEWPTRGFERSRECFERAIRLAPAYAEAHFGLALYYGIGAAMGLLRPIEAWRSCQVGLATAMRLDSTLGENHNGLAAVRLYLHRDWAGAEAAFKQALAIDPDDAETHNHYGFSLALFGRTDDALARIKRAIELDPLSLRFHWNLAFVYYQARRHVDAIEWCQRTLDLDSTYSLAYALMGDAHEQRGEAKEALHNWRRASPVAEDSGDGVDDNPPDEPFNPAREHFWRRRLEELLSCIGKGEFVPAMHVARAHARLGDTDAALAWIGKALHEPNRLVLELPLDPLFERFHGHPRFNQMTETLPNGHLCRHLR